MTQPKVDKPITCMKCGEVANVNIYKDGLSGHCCVECAMEFEKTDKNITLTYMK